MNQEKPPPSPPAFDEGRLDVGDGHRIWYAQYGNPDGIALLWLHGGPGSGPSLRHLQLMDLLRYRVVLVSQRGCGPSSPAGEIACNETSLLVQDIAQLRSHLGLAKLVLGGGSWGAALALAYAASHRQTLAALILRAPFLAERREIAAFFQPATDGPDPCWEEFAEQAPPSQRHDLLSCYADQLTGPDHHRCAAIARAWSRFQQRRELDHGNFAEVAASDEDLIARYRIQAHYLRNGCFLAKDMLLTTARNLGGLPVAILHGTHDRICPVQNADRLHRKIAGSALRLVPEAGHDPFHPEMAGALRQALDSYASQGNFHGWGKQQQNADLS